MASANGNNGINNGANQWRINIEIAGINNIEA